MKLLLAIGLSVLGIHAALCQPAQIILIRHAEKPEDTNAVHLSKEGEKRAKELVAFIKTDPELTKFGLPVALYATHPTRHGHGVRTAETITPLAKELHLSVQEPYLSEDYQGLAKSVLSNPRYTGKCVLICWNHTEIPQLAAALGVRPEPPKWRENVFDRVLLITYEGGKAILKNLPQVLESSKSKKKTHKAS
jgi:hypothetical protein